VASSHVDDGYLFGKRKTLVIFLGLVMGMLLASVNQSILATAVPKIVVDLGGFNDYAWIFTAYMLTTTITVPVYGKLSDMYGRRPFFALAILIFMAGSIIGGLATSMTMLIVARAIQGVGAGGLIPIAIASIGDLIAPRERGKWQGLTGAIFGVSSVVGPTVGGYIVDTASWRWAFFVSLPFGVASLAVVWFTFRVERQPRIRRIDYAGVALMALAVGTGLLATVWGGTKYPWGSPEIVGLYGVCAVATAAFLWWEPRAPEPLLPLSLFRNRTFAAAMVALLAIGAVMFGAIVYIPLYVQGVLGESATQSGAILAPLMLGLIGASVVAGQIVTRSGHYKPILLTSPFVLATGYVMLTHLSPDSTTDATRLYSVTVGIGVGLALGTLTLVVQNSVRREVMGVATSATQFFRSIGSTIGVAIMGTIITAGLHNELAARLTTAQQRRLGGDNAPSKVIGSLHRLPGDVATQVRDALAAAIHPAFVVGLPLIGVAFVALLFVERRPLRRTIREDVPLETGRELLPELGELSAEAP
jgi:EmrB/QacA subfamily drug resistance transporter